MTSYLTNDWFDWEKEVEMCHGNVWPGESPDRMSEMHVTTTNDSMLHRTNGDQRDGKLVEKNQYNNNKTNGEGRMCVMK